MRIHFPTVGRRIHAILAIALVAASAPLALAAQEPAPAPEDSQVQTVSQEEMTHYVELQLEIDALQEEAIQEMVRTHSEDGRARIRGNLTEAIAQAHEEHGMTQERYKTLTFLISSDTATRDLFESTMATAREGGGGQG